MPSAIAISKLIEKFPPSLAGHRFVDFNLVGHFHFIHHDDCVLKSSKKKPSHEIVAKYKSGIKRKMTVGLAMPTLSS